jgi:hypothetical protein
MELTERVANLEKGLTDLRVDVSSVKQRLDSEMPQLATKADLADLKIGLGEIRTEIHKEFSAQTWKIMALIVSLVLGVFGLMRMFPPKIEIPPIQVQYPPVQSEPTSLTPSQPTGDGPREVRPKEPK